MDERSRLQGFGADPAQPSVDYWNHHLIIKLDTCVDAAHTKAETQPSLQDVTILLPISTVGRADGRQTPPPRDEQGRGAS